MNDEKIKFLINESSGSRETLLILQLKIYLLALTVGVFSVKT